MYYKLEMQELKIDDDHKMHQINTNNKMWEINTSHKMLLNRRHLIILCVYRMHNGYKSLTLELQ